MEGERVRSPSQRKHDAVKNMGVVLVLEKRNIFSFEIRKQRKYR